MAYDSYVRIDDSSNDNGYIIFPVVNVNLNINQPIDSYGVPRGEPRCQLFKLHLAGHASGGRQDPHSLLLLTEWALDRTMQKSGTIRFMDSTALGGSSSMLTNHNFRFEDTYCVGYELLYDTEAVDGIGATNNTTYSRDYFTVILTLSPMHLLFNDTLRLSSPVATPPPAESDTGSSESSSGSSSSSSEVSSFRAD